jgi:methionyl-tRNA synthetase
MSKSLGNVIDPLAEAEKWGLDIYRYFLAREMTFGSDGDYSSKALVGRNNSELADDLGNLLSRVVAMIHRYFDGQMPEIKEANAEDAALLKELDLLAEELPGHLERCAIHSFLERVNQTVVAVNKYLTDQAPWTLAKSDKFERVGSVLAVACQMLAGVGKLLSPVMPDKMGELLAVFGLPRPTIFKNEPVAPGTAVQKVSPLFPQLEWIDPAAAEASLAAQANNTPTEAGKGAFTPVPPKPEIPFDDFAKVDLRIATVKVAERVPKTDKLMRLEIDLGFETRQIVAGVAEKYSPEQLIGRQIVVVANLAPRKLKGLESKGMLLAGRAGDELLLLRPDNTLPPGADVS